MKTLLTLLSLCCWVQSSQAITIATGTPEATYYQIAQDIKRVAEAEGVPVEIIQTNGSFDNLNLLLSGKIDLAIIQLDVLKFVTEFARAGSKEDILEEVKVLLNLYPEEIHVLTKTESIRSFHQLDGKRVAVGLEGSGSALTAELLLSSYDLKVEKSYDAPSEALRKMEEGGLDAMIFVAGAPVALFQNLNPNYRLVRLPKNPLLEEIYSKRLIDSSLYSWAGEAETLTVPSVIMTRNRSDREYILTMQKLLMAILSNRDALSANGHPKWKQSDVGYVTGRLAYRPAVEALLLYTIVDTLGYKIIKK